MPQAAAERRPLPAAAAAWLLAAPFVLWKLLISPLLGPRCRFAPSCSEYAAQAIKKHGVLKGGYLTVRRLCRCHPWGGCGVDQVP